MKIQSLILYYTDNCLKESINSLVRENLTKRAMESGCCLVSVGRKSDGFGNLNITVDLQERSRKAMFTQMFIGLDQAQNKLQFDPTKTYVFTAEHDVLYPEHYFDVDFALSSSPIWNDTYSYCSRRYLDKNGYWYDSRPMLSTLFCRCYELIHHLSLRLYRINRLGMKKGGWTNSEPGVSEGDTTGNVSFRMPTLNGMALPLDIRHDNNLSRANLTSITVPPFVTSLMENHNDEYWGPHEKYAQLFD